MSESTASPAVSKRGGSFGKDMTTGSVAKNLLFFSIPMLMGSVAHTAYSIINAIWVGRGLGPSAMAAVTISFPIFFILMAVAGGLTLATNILVSQAYGAKDFDRMAAVIRNSVVLTAIAAAVCLVVGHFSAETLVYAMGAPADTAPLAIPYLRLFILTTPFMFGVFLIASILRGVGDSKTPLYFQVASLVVTALLDPFLMFGWLGFPKLGLNGTAVATIIAQAGALTSIIVYLFYSKHFIMPKGGKYRFDPSVSLLTLKIGLPSMLQQLCVSLGMMCIIGLVNRFGTHCAAAYGNAMRIDQLAFMPAMALGMAASTLAGQNIGAGLYDRVSRVLRWGVVLGVLLTLPGTIMSLTMPHLLMRMFAKDADVIATGVHYLRIASVGYLLVSVMFVSNGVINGSGHTLATTLFTLVVFFFVRIPTGALFSKLMNDVSGIWYAILLSYAFGAVMSLSYYYSGRWKKAVSRKIPKPTALEQSMDVELLD
jgi:putative MATE family efflux protein